jgi:hypothetical protein
MGMAAPVNAPISSSERPSEVRKNDGSFMKNGARIAKLRSVRPSTARTN